VIGDLLTAVGRLERVHDFTGRLRFNTAQAAEYANCHPDTILRSLQAGELHGGGQRKAGGRWSIRRSASTPGSMASSARINLSALRASAGTWMRDPCRDGPGSGPRARRR
jgi:hypothetical protein